MTRGMPRRLATARPISPNGPGVGTTIVHWGFEADYGINIVGRYFASLLGGVVARDYEAGLAGLKELAESLPRGDFSDIEIQHMVVEASEIAYVSTNALPEPGAISDAMGAAYFPARKAGSLQPVDILRGLT